MSLFDFSGICALRGAACVSSDTQQEVDRVTSILLEKLFLANKLALSRVAFMQFSVTEDIRSWNPATSARLSGYKVPLFCVREAEFDGSMKHCIRVVILYRGVIRKPAHVYCEGAESLRPDLS